MEEVSLGDVSWLVYFLLVDRPLTEIKITRRLFEETDFKDFKLLRYYDRITETYTFKLEEK